MKKVIRIKNNNVYIGSLKVDMKAIKNFAFIAGTAFVIISSASLIKKSADIVREPKTAGEDPITDGTLTQESASSKKTYEAEYVVQNCDTLSGIVASYQTDPNKMYGIIEKIADKNKLKNPNSLRAGETITLYGIPEEHLIDFGYTIDYTKTDPEYELEDLSNYIDEAITYAYITDDNAQQFADFEAKYSYASNIYAKYMEAKDELLFDSLIDQYRSLAQEISNLTGYDYSHSIKAHKISETKGLGL